MSEQRMSQQQKEASKQRHLYLVPPLPEAAKRVRRRKGSVPWTWLVPATLACISAVWLLTRYIGR